MPPANPVSAADARLREIGAAYPTRSARRSLDAVFRLTEAARVEFPPTNVVVVGTNGKTSTATFIARFVRARGRLDGLTTSPHIAAWGERVRVGEEAVPDELLVDAVERLHGVAAEIGGDELRFFDLLTLAAAEIFVSRAVDVGVFEAGIGGRLDATRVVPAAVVALTGIGIDHAELLGASETEILREKLGIADAGSTVVAAQLPPDLSAVAQGVAADTGFSLTFVSSEEHEFLGRNADLAAAAVELLGIPAETELDDVDRTVLGRMHRLDSDGVSVLVDAAHNPQAWSEIETSLPSAFVAVVSISADRPAAALAAALGNAVAVVTTTAWEGRSLPAGALAAAFGGSAVPIDDPGEAVARARELARSRAVPLVVLGSTYLLPHAYRVL